jgi:hypothetical protein
VGFRWHAARTTPGHMAATRIEPWTIPFHVAMWTVLSVGFIMVLVVVLMN